MTKKTFFPIISILLFSISSFFCNIENENNKNIIQKLNEYKPVLEEFLIKNNFLKNGEDIKNGIASFISDLEEKQSFKYYTPPSIAHKYCELFEVENLYTEIWRLDSSMIYIGSLTDTIGKPSLQIEKQLVTNNEYFNWFKKYQNEQQPCIKEYIQARIYEDIHFTSSILLRGIGKNINVDYSDEVLHAIIIAELLVDVIAFNCFEEDIKITKVDTSSSKVDYDYFYCKSLDTSINNIIFLNHPESFLKVLEKGNQLKSMSNDRIYFINTTETVYFSLQQNYGGYFDEYKQIEIGQIDENLNITAKEIQQNWGLNSQFDTLDKMFNSSDIENIESNNKLSIGSTIGFFETSMLYQLNEFEKSIIDNTIKYELKSCDYLSEYTFKDGLLYYFIFGYKTY